MAAEEDEQQLVEAVARQEWKEAGYDPGAFTMDGYNKQLLSKEMGNQDKDWRFNDISRQSFLSEKAAIIEMERERRLTLEKVQQGVQAFAADRATDVLRAGMEVVNIFEPGFMRRARQQRRHLARIAQAEADAERVVMERTEAQARRKQWTKLEVQSRKERAERVAARGPTAKISHDVSAVAEEERRLAEINEFRERSLATLEAKNNALLEKQARAAEAKEAREIEVRKWRAGYWKEASESASATAKEMIEAAAAERAALERQLVAYDDAELADREAQRTHDQVSGPSISDDPSGLGVFGTPWEKGMPASDPRNRLAGAEDSEVKLFSATPNSAFEEQVLELHDLQATEARTEELYASLTNEVQVCDSELASLSLLRHRVGNEHSQLQAETKLYTQTFFGPPRREPAPHQIEAQHLRVQRIKDLTTRLSQIDKRAGELRTRKGQAQSQSITVAKQVATARSERKAKDEELANINEGLGELPMVLGRSLGAIGGKGSEVADTVAGQENYDLIRHELVFREIETQVAAAQKTHKGSLAAGTAEWGMEQHRINENAMLSITMNKLAALAEGVKIARSKDVVSDVVNAVEMFHVKNAKLQETNHKCEGPIDWWACREKYPGQFSQKKGAHDTNHEKKPGAGGAEETKESTKEKEEGGDGKDDKEGEEGDESELKEQPSHEDSDASSSLEQPITVVAWPSSDQIADDFLNKKGLFKPEGAGNEEEDEDKDDDDEGDASHHDDGEEGGEGGEEQKSQRELLDEAASAASSSSKKDKKASSELQPKGPKRRGGGNLNADALVLAAAESTNQIRRVGARHAGRERAEDSDANANLASMDDADGTKKAAALALAKRAAQIKQAQAEEKDAALLALPHVDDEDPLWQGVTLRGDRMNGSISGVVHLPRFDYFSIHIVVSKTKPLELDQGHKEDSITIRIGHDMKNLAKIATVTNEPDPISGQYRHEIEHHIRGSHFAYRFDWACESLDPELLHRLTLERGFFELHVMPPLEVIAPEPNAVNQMERCVSSFVKKIRMETNEQAETKALTEMIAASGVETRHFDSDAVHVGYPQRYEEKKHFIKMIKSEIKARAKSRARAAAKEAKELEASIEREKGEAALLAAGQGGGKSGTKEKDKKKKTAAEGAASAGKNEAGGPSQPKGNTAEDHLAAKLEISKRAFLDRKRLKYQPEIDAAEALAGKRIEVLWGSDWQRAVVEACRIEWVQDGLIPKPLHKVVPVDDKERTCGEPVWEDLGKRRWYERQAIAAKEVDEAAAAAWAANEQRRKNLLEERLSEEAKVAAKLDAREKWVQALIDEEEIRRAEGEGVAAARFDSAARVMAKSKVAAPAISMKTTRIVGDYRIGHNTPTGLPTPISERDAKQIAIGEWVDEQVAGEMKSVAEEWAARRRNLDAFILEQRTAWEKIDAINADRQKRIDAKRQAELSVLRGQRTVELRKRLTLPDFDKIQLSKPHNCEHVRCRAWGDCYGKGVRCVECGQEMSKTHESFKQLAGVGSGDNSTLVEQVDRHRRNEASYRFRTKEELAAVEAERLRLEKDRRDVELIDPLFYDFTDPEFIYDLDRRHRIELKENNVVRQGVQWRPEEMKAAQDEIKEEVEAMTDPAARAKREEAVAQWYLEQSPPPFRKTDLAHRAQFRQMIHTHGRIHNYRQRIGELEHTLASFKTETEECTTVLDFLHRNIFSLERGLNSIEADLEGVSTVIAIDRAAAKQLRETRSMAILADEDLREKEMDLVGMVEDADAAEEEALALTKVVREVIRRRVIAERKLNGLFKRVKNVRRKANALLPARSDAARTVHSMHYRKFGVVVPTPYGNCRVLVYREEDQMLVCQLPFGKPRARLYIPLAVPMQLEKAREEAERVAMERCEEELRGVYAWEKDTRKREYELMNAEEHTLRAHFRRVDEAAAEDAALEAAVQQGVEDAQKFLLLPAGKKVIKGRAMKLLDEEIKKRTREIAAWRGIGNIPKKLKEREKEEFIEKQLEPESVKFVEEQRMLALLEAKSLVAARHQRHLVEAEVTFLFDLFLADLTSEVASVELAKDVEAKKRLESQTGLFFPDPKHMTFSVYSTLSRWWADEKAHLRSNLERWGAASVQDRLRQVSDAEKAAARKRKLEENLHKMQAFEAQQRECDAMWEAEKEVRKVYRAELKASLAERRLMKDEEHHMRAYLKEAAALAAAQSSNKYKVVGMESADEDNGMSAKERRRLDLKKSGIEKQKLKQERDAMLHEDQLSFDMRLEEQQQLQKEALKAQMLLMGAPGGDEDDDDEEDTLKDDDEDDNASSGGKDPSLGATKRKLKAEASKRAKEERERNEAAAKAHFEAIRRDAYCAQAKIEVAWMELEEEARRGEADLDRDTAELRRLHLIAQVKGQEALRAKAHARKCRKAADKALGALEAAQKWQASIAQQMDKCERTRARVHVDTKYMDTCAVAGTAGFYYQRLVSSNLHDILTRQYFEKLLHTITNRAELLATERRLNELASSTQTANRQLRDKIKGVKVVWGELRRRDYLRLKRSDLGRKMFRQWQGTILGAAFKGWVQFYMWQQGVRSAYMLDYATIKHSLDIKRTKGSIREANERKAYTVTADYSKTGPQKKPLYKGQPQKAPKKPSVPKSLLQRHIARPVKCRHCALLYLESQNHAIACPYHPGEYKAACPAWCPGLTPKCSSHRSKRWSCCDVRELGKFGSSGCRQRFHMPVESDPDYSAAVLEKTLYFNEKISEADAKLAVIEKADTMDEARKIKMKQLQGVAAKMDEERAVVKRADLYNFTPEILDSYKDDVRKELEEMAKHARGAPGSMPIASSALTTVAATK